jgi:hypothetical protein
MESTINTTKRWHVELIQSVQGLCEQFGLDDQATQSFRDLMMTIAKEQYKVGNRSGIAWARKNPPRPSGAAA